MIFFIAGRTTSSTKGRTTSSTITVAVCLAISLAVSETRQVTPNAAQPTTRAAPPVNVTLTVHPTQTIFKATAEVVVISIILLLYERAWSASIRESPDAVSLT
jgi:hypothetical protein